jgi:hypothetical protein
MESPKAWELVLIWYSLEICARRAVSEGLRFRFTVLSRFRSEGFRFTLLSRSRHGRTESGDKGKVNAIRGGGGGTM